jgi:hypothetical protein
MIKKHRQALGLAPVTFLARNVVAFELPEKRPVSVWLTTVFCIQTPAHGIRAPRVT